MRQRQTPRKRSSDKLRASTPRAPCGPQCRGRRFFSPRSRRRHTGRRLARTPSANLESGSRPTAPLPRRLQRKRRRSRAQVLRSTCRATRRLSSRMLRRDWLHRGASAPALSGRRGHGVLFTRRSNTTSTVAHGGSHRKRLRETDYTAAPSRLRYRAVVITPCDSLARATPT